MKLKQFLALIIAAVAVLSGVEILVSHTKATNPEIVNRTVTLSAIPPPFSHLKIGMSEDQVLSIVGSPITKSIYPEYVHKSVADWEKIQREVDESGSLTDDYGGAIDMMLVKEKTELTHRYHDIWYYMPAQGIYVNLYMNDDKTLGTIIGDPASVSPPRPAAPKQ